MGDSRTGRARRWVVVLTVAVTVVGLADDRSHRATAAPTPIDTNSAAAVRDAYRTWFLPSQAVPVSWTGSIESCQPGTTGAATQEATLSAVNFFRAMGGLAPVTFSATSSEQAQAAALVMAANNQLSHSIDASWRCWSQAAQTGAAGSNLYLGVAGAKAIAGYMVDPGGGNTAVGHRRWIMRPETTVMGAGTTDRSQALAVLGAQGPATSDPAWVPWPTAGFFPADLEPNGRWSLSSSDPANFNGATVTVTDTFGQPVAVAGVNRPAYGYGDDTLVWQMANPADLRPTGLVTRTFNVTVAGIVRGGSTVSYAYQVRSFDATNDGAGLPADPICGSDRGIPVTANQAGVAAASLQTGSDVVQFTKQAVTGALACRSSSGGNWYSPVNLGGIVSGNPTAATTPDGTLRVLVRGIDGALWMRTRNPAGQWTAWQSLGGIITTSPAVAARPDGSIVIVARGSDNALWTRTATTGWVSLGGVLGTSEGFGRLDTAADAGVASWPDGTIEIVARGQDNALWRRTLTTGWTSLGGIAHSGPSVAVQGNRIHVLVRGTDGGLYWRTGTDGWQSLGGLVGPTLGAVTRADGVTMVLVRGVDANSYHRTLDAGAGTWSSWQSSGFPG